MQDCATVQAPDWNLIRELYTQGLRCAQIEAQTGVKAGTVASRASRCKWKSVAMLAKQTVQNAMEQPKEDSGSESKLNSSSERTRTRLARLLERSVEKIEQMPIPTHKVALRVNSELESVVRNAKTVFGWSDSTQAPAVRISIMSQATLVKVDSSQPASQPAIDVASEAVPVVEEKELLNPPASTGQTDP